MAAPAVLLLRVAQAWPLPGLGLLALPDGPALALANHELHTALAVEAILPDGARYPGMATVEEISRLGEVVPSRGLLLDFSAPIEVPAGTEVWLAEPESDPFMGLD
ncbi:hypothetical protein Q5H92_02750 [Hymenobacter sp. M29]|uniref:Uncharacterized protein n=1 Tax=Hymenobacter mellowenesis TaxID=3063995 RepID=A0ABT9A5Z9_9BACT|nr:hypothetical protein [Hymenobacter sp. M29]MDO7845260.1 hypothetical protein [Hymenobacter sp. M29]